MDEVQQEPADALLVDVAFIGGAFLLGGRRSARPPLLVTSVIPLPITSRDTAPYGMGLLPMRGPVGRVRNRLLSTLAFTGAAIAVLGLVHALLGLDTLFGVIAFVHARPPLVTPFGNPNHLAAFLGLSATVSLGLALSSEGRTRAVPYVLASLLGGTGTLMR